MDYYLKSLGTERERLPADWVEADGPDRLRHTWFPRRPRSEPGDRLVYYAAGWRRCFGVFEVVGEPANEPPHPRHPERWPWALEVRPLVVVPSIPLAPSLEAIGVDSLSVRRQSHIHLTPERFERAVEKIAEVAR